MVLMTAGRSVMTTAHAKSPVRLTTARTQRPSRQLTDVRRWLIFSSEKDRSRLYCFSNGAARENDSKSCRKKIDHNHDCLPCHHFGCPYDARKCVARTGRIDVTGSPNRVSTADALWVKAHFHLDATAGDSRVSESRRYYRRHLLGGRRCGSQ